MRISRPHLGGGVEDLETVTGGGWSYTSGAAARTEDRIRSKRTDEKGGQSHIVEWDIENPRTGIGGGPCIMIGVVAWPGKSTPNQNAPLMNALESH